MMKMNQRRTFQLTETDFPIKKVKRKPLPMIKPIQLIRAEKKNKHLVKLLNNKMFTGYRHIKNGKKYIQHYHDQLRLNTEEKKLYPFQEEYETLYKYKYLPNKYKQINWRNTLDIIPLTTIYNNTNCETETISHSQCPTGMENKMVQTSSIPSIKFTKSNNIHSRNELSNVKSSFTKQGKSVIITNTKRNIANNFTVY